MDVHQWANRGCITSKTREKREGMNLWLTMGPKVINILRVFAAANGRSFCARIKGRHVRPGRPHTTWASVDLSSVIGAVEFAETLPGKESPGALISQHGRG